MKTELLMLNILENSLRTSPNCFNYFGAEQPFVNDLMPSTGIFLFLTFPTIIGGLLTWIPLQVSKCCFFSIVKQTHRVYSRLKIH